MLYENKYFNFWYEEQLNRNYYNRFSILQTPDLNLETPEPNTLPDYTIVEPDKPTSYPTLSPTPFPTIDITPTPTKTPTPIDEYIPGKPSSTPTTELLLDTNYSYTNSSSSNSNFLFFENKLYNTLAFIGIGIVGLITLICLKQKCVTNYEINNNNICNCFTTNVYRDTNANDIENNNSDSKHGIPPSAPDDTTIVYATEVYPKI